VSEYVEARYVKSVLREARSAVQEITATMINDLSRDLSSLQTLNDQCANLEVDAIARAESCSGSITSCP
jgi:hypothetical protein